MHQTEEESKLDASDDIWTIVEVANYLRLNPQTVYRLTQQGQLPGFKVGRHWRFKREHISKWMEEQIKKQPSSAEKP
jgi:excisionase family DNA binding protein